MVKRVLARILSVTVMSTMIFSNTAFAMEENDPNYVLYKDSSKSVDQRVEDLINRMTLDEKIGQMVQAERAGVSNEDVTNYALGSVLSGGGSLPTTGNSVEDWENLINGYQKAAMSSRLGIPLLYGVDAVHGHNNVYGTTIFPHNIGLGATGNIGLVKRIGQATAEEMRATGANWTFAPTLGVLHNERWGRSYETFGEESELVTKMGDAYIRGLQGDIPEKTLLYPNKVIATAKHYIGEGLTTNGANQGNVEMSDEEFQKYLEEELLPPYKKAIEDGVRSVMLSYNSINGVKCHGNKELVTDLLKGELGFTGIVVSDYDGVNQIKGPNGEDVSFKEQVKISVNAGMDMIMTPGSWKAFITNLKELVQSGEVSEDRINDAVRRILRVKFEMGLFEDPYAQSNLSTTVGSSEHREIARQAVRESLVLLKNDNNIVGSLKDKKNILVAGKSADDMGIQCGGWTISWQGSEGNITEGTTLLQGIKNTVGDDVKVTYNKRGRASAENDVAVVFIGEKPYSETNGDRSPSELTLDSEDLTTIKNIKETRPDLPIVAVLVTGRPITIADQVEDFDGIVSAWLPGTEGQGVADVLFGDYDFTGKLTVTWPWYASDIESKHEEGKALFECGYGLKKGETSSLPDKPEIEDNINYVDITENEGKIEAESFASTSIKNGTGGLEYNSNVSGGVSVGYIGTNDWLDYGIYVPEDGKFEVELGIASPNGVNNGANLYVDSELSSVIDIPKTGAWNVWGATKGIINIKAGNHILKFKAGKDGFNFDYMKFTRVGDYENTVEKDDVLSKGNILSEDAVNVWMSSSEQSQSMSWYDSPKEIENKVSKKEALDITSIDSQNITTIKVDPKEEYQKFLGMGTSIEEATVNNLSKMDDSVRREFIKNLLDPVNGTGTTLIRLTIGTSDFTARNFYTYFDNKPKDINNPDWENEFSIQKDIDYKIIKTIKEIQEIAKELGVEDELKFFSSSWTPPGWMKLETSSSKSYPNNDLLLKGGKLNDDYIDDLAKYYTRYLEEYAKLGINIYAMTLQNEPELEINYPSCNMTSTQEAKLAKAIKDEVSKSAVLKEKGVNPKLWAFDHNFSSAMSFMNTAFSYDYGMESIDGVAFHDYGGEPTAMTEMKNKYPSKTMNLTERSVWGTQGADRITQYFRNNAESYNSWVTMLDSNIATHQWVGTPDPTSFVQDANDPNNYWATPEVYIASQFSRFIRPGYVRIGSNYGSSSTVTNVAFKDTETGKIVMVVTNQTDEKQAFKIVCDGTQIIGNIPAKNVATYEWTPLSGINPIDKEVSSTNYSGISNDGAGIGGDDKDYIGNLKDGSWIDYMVDVKEAGQYNVVYEVATAYNNDKSITMLQGDNVLGKVDFVNNWSDESNSTWAWWDFFKVQHSVKFDNTGIQKIRIKIGQGEFNLKSIRFEKVKEIHEIPGKIAANNFMDSKGVIVENGNIGYFGSGDKLSYKVNAQSAGDYKLNMNLSSNNGENPSFNIYSNDSLLKKVDVNSTGDINRYEYKDCGVIHLEAGEQIITVEALSDFNLRELVFGTAISVEVLQDIQEENENEKQIEVLLIDGEFKNSLSKEYFTLINLPVGVDFEVNRIDNKKAILTLKGNRTVDYDYDRDVVVKVKSEAIDGATSSYLVEDSFSITAKNDKEVLTIDKESIPMGTSSIMLNLEGGTFINNEELFSGIELSGDASEYIKIKSFERINGSIKLNLEWTKAYYENLELTVTVPHTAYSDSNNEDLSAKVICQGSSENPDAIKLDKKLTLKESDAYRNKGSISSNVKAGNRVDFYLDVKEAGEYTVIYDVYNSSAVDNAIKISGGVGTGVTGNLSSISLGNFWSKTLSIKDTIRLEKGEQTLRIETNNAGFEIKGITIEKKADAQMVNATVSGEETIVKADSFYQGSNNKAYAIENKNGMNNIGCTVPGAYLDYFVNVSKSGMYRVSYNYATSSNGAPSAIIQQVINNEAKTLGVTTLSSTESWENFKYSDSIFVNLQEGEQVIRVLVDGDGFNYRDIKFEYVLDKEAPVLDGKDGVVEAKSDISSLDLIKILGISAIDKIEGDITSKVQIDTSKVNINKVGKYEVKVNVSDSSGNKANELTLVLEVKNDITKPTIDGSNITLPVGSTFDPIKDLKLSVIDNIDGDITKKAGISHNVDTNKQGIYTVTVVVEDNEGNKAERTFVVRVLETGIINAGDITIEVGNIFDALDGVTAEDMDGSDITSSIEVISNNVDTNVAGEYEVVYKVVDMEGNIITKSIKVKVVEKGTSDGGEDNTDKPSSGDDNEGGSKPSDENNHQGDNSDSVKTGDANNYGGNILALALSLICMLFFIKRK